MFPPVEQGSFFAELKRRNVYKVAVAYAVVAWLVIQAASIVFPTFNAPPWLMQALVIVTALGFLIALIIAWAFEMTPEGMKRTGNISPDERLPQWSRRKFAALIATLAMLAAALLIFQLAGKARWAVRPDKGDSRRVTAPLPIPEKSIAVLPLVNQSDDPAQEYFSDGLTEELINGLGQIPELHVTGRTSSFQFKGKSGDLREVGRTLGVANILEGSVRKSENRIRIRIALVSTADGSQRWSQTYDRELKAVFEIQEEIARSVADQLRLTLTGQQKQVSAQPSNGSLEAYNAYLQAEHYDRAFNLESAQKAIEHSDQAIRLDPRYAEAYAVNALAHNRIGYLRGAKGLDAFAKAKQAAKTALSIKPTLPRAKSALAYVYLNAEWNLAAAAAELKDASRQEVSVVTFLAFILSYQGRMDEAADMQKQAIAVDPLAAVAHSNLAWMFILAGRVDEAEAALRRSIELQPEAANNHLRLVTVELHRPRPDLQTAMREARLEPPGVLRDTALAFATAAAGNRAEADAALQTLIAEHAEVSPFRVATVYAYRKEPDKVFEWLERAYAVRDPRLISLRADPELRAYESDPRFASLCQKIGVPAPAPPKQPSP